MAKAVKVWTFIYAERQPTKKDGSPSEKVKFDPVDKRCPAFGLYFHRTDERFKGKDLEKLEIEIANDAIVIDG